MWRVAYSRWAEHGTRNTKYAISFDQTSWVRGQSYELTSIFHLPADLPEGVYDLRIAMTDWEGNPAPRLAIAGDRGHKRYRLGRVRVSEDADHGDHWTAGWCR